MSYVSGIGVATGGGKMPTMVSIRRPPSNKTDHDVRDDSSPPNLEWAAASRGGVGLEIKVMHGQWKSNGQ